MQNDFARKFRGRISDVKKKLRLADSKGFQSEVEIPIRYKIRLKGCNYCHFREPNSNIFKDDFGKKR